MTRPVPIEVCIACDNKNSTRASVKAAGLGGAARIEVCARMDLGGTTPDRRLIEVARRSFEGPGEILVMIRPRGGDFVYSEAEIAAMKTDIDMAADEAVTGVVFGAVDGLGQLSDLIEQSRDRIEIVVAGGVSSSNAPELITQLSRHGEQFSLHAYSSLLADSINDTNTSPIINLQLVERLVAVAY